MKPEVKLELENMLDTAWKAAAAKQDVQAMVSLISLTITVKG